jgi:homoserine O-succinyltransferase/O-acetyltransferase
MPVRLMEARCAAEPSGFSRGLNIGLINNMPDAALKATERQFTTLLDAASPDVEVNLFLYALPTVPRGEAGRRHIGHSYLDPETLFDSRLDGLIVTGTEPRAADLRDEPYWHSLAQVMEWAEANTRSTVWSCLAAHAAVQHLDGILRRRFAEKRFGVFECEVTSAHQLLAGIQSSLHVPHSRWNDIPAGQLAERGYTALTRSADGGVDAFVRQRRSLFLFFQGHPEYQSDTLLLEYRRDIGRFVKRERDDYPLLPEGYFDRETEDLLAAVRERIVAERSENSLVHFPTALLSTKVQAIWRPVSMQIYRNWLGYLLAGQSHHLSAAPLESADAVSPGRWCPTR